MGVAVGEGTPETDALAAGEADMGRLVEVQGTLAHTLPMGGLFTLERSDGGGRRERLWLSRVFIGGSVGFPGFGPHSLSNYYKVPLVHLSLP